MPSARWRCELRGDDSQGPSRPGCDGAILTTLPVGEAAAQKTEKINGYAEFKKGDTLIVEGQRVVAGPGTKVTGPKLSALGSIPLGYEVKLEGRRDPAGTLVAGKVEA